MISRRTGMAILAGICFLCSSLIANAAPGSGKDWPHWRGENRDGTVAGDSGFSEGVWPTSAPLWKTRVGAGSTAPLVVGGVLYTAGWSNGADTVVALDAESGQPLWSQRYSSPEYGRHSTGDKGMYNGMSSTPEYDYETGYLYTLGCDGDLFCWNTKKGGEKVWHVNLYAKYGVPRRPQVTDRRGSLRDYGYTTAPLAVGSQLIVEVGSDKGNLVGFDKRTGAELWKSENRDPAGHSGGLVPMTVDGVHCVAVLTALNLVVVRLDAGNVGKTVAEFSWTTDFINNIATPVVVGNRVIITSRYNKAAAVCVEVSLTRGAKQIWISEAASGVCSPVLHAGHLHWANKGIHCVDLATGKLNWKGGKITDAGSCVITADGRMIVWGNGGDLILCETAERSPEKYIQLSEQKRIFNDKAWPHLVLANDLLYVKDTSGNLACISLRKADKNRSGATVSVEPQIPSGKPVQVENAVKLELKDWPGSADDMLFAWKAGWGKAKVEGTFSAASPRVRFATRGDADTGPSGEFSVVNGAVFLPALDGYLLEKVKKDGALTLEAVLTTADLNQSGPARIISFSKDGHNRNFTLGQERNQLVYRLRTTATGSNGSRPETKFGEVSQGHPVHVAVTYEPGELRAYVNGEEVLRSDKVRGDFSNWEPMNFIIGDEWEDSRNWNGSVSAVGIWSRALSPEEVRARFALSK